MTAKVKVLFLASNPCKQDRLAVDEESRAVAARIRSADHRDALGLIPAYAVRPDDLQPLLMQHKPHVIHLSGHGTLSTPSGRDGQGERGASRDMIVKGFGRDIQSAFTLGKNALMYLQIPEDHLPCLFWRQATVSPAKVVLVEGSVASAPKSAGSPPATGRAAPPREEATDNLLHLMWDCLDANLQDAFSLAYNKKRRQGGNRISTKDFFQALVRLEDDSVKSLIGSLPTDSLPDPIDPAVSNESRLVLDENPLLSDCVADSLEHFKEMPALPRKLSPADMFVDIAKYGHGESVSRLRQHGIGKQEIEERVRKLGLPVIRRAPR